MSNEEREGILKSEKKKQSKYVFGETEYECEKSFVFPIWIGKKKVFVETDIINGRIPWLIGNRVLLEMGAVLNIKERKIVVDSGGEMDLNIDDSGHLNIVVKSQKLFEKVWINFSLKGWNEGGELWKKTCERLHLQFGHCSGMSLKRMIIKACQGGENNEKKEWRDKLKTVEEICDKCEICMRYKRNPPKPVVGVPLAEHFNEVLTLDLGELEGNKFLVMVDWATRYCQSK